MKWVATVYISIFFGWMGGDLFFLGKWKMALIRTAALWACFGLASWLGNSPPGDGLGILFWVFLARGLYILGFLSLGAIVFLRTFFETESEWGNDAEPPGWILGTLYLLGAPVLVVLLWSPVTRVITAVSEKPAVEIEAVVAADSTALLSNPFAGGDTVQYLKKGAAVTITGKSKKDKGEPQRQWAPVNASEKEGWVLMEDVDLNK